ncbi:tyrosine-type recombinase/integrase [Uliginosibacterium sp. sgz301328]|uniref:tyrosine-type recombinase/integrase n=1 Tax=Uliginosibacterium sp. sgz301328 TaxID=3243764 RepID=UPI00359E2D98
MLTDRQIMNLKATGKPYRVVDGRNLVVAVSAVGTCTFQLRYCVTVGNVRKERLHTLGRYPSMSLAQARQEAETIRGLVAQGKDPSLVKRAAKLVRATNAVNTFQSVYETVMSLKEAQCSPRHCRILRLGMQKHVLPHIGAFPMAEITKPMLITIVTDIYRSARVLARRLAWLIGEVFRAAERRGIASGYVAHAIVEELPRPKTQHMPSLKRPEEVAGLLQTIDAKASIRMRVYFRLLAYLFTRPSELAGARWDEVDLEGATWTIPAVRMKARQVHIIPLPHQAVTMLRELRLQTGVSGYLFPSSASGSAHIGRSTPSIMMAGLGYKGRHSPHGFRATASTLLREALFPRDLVELSLAHAPGGAVELAYMHAQWLTPRRRMMQAYADFLEGLARGDDPSQCFAELAGQSGHRLAA